MNFMFFRLYKKITVVLFLAIVVSGIVRTVVNADTEAVQIVVLMSQVAEHYKEALVGYKEFLANQNLKTDFHVFNLKGDSSKAAGIIENRI